MVDLKNGATSDDPRLDRVVQFDDKSREFQVRALLGSHARTLAKKRRHIVPGLTLDQGREGACTGFSAAHAVASTPFRAKPIDGAKAREFYYENQRNDAYPGGEYEGADPRSGGSSVLAAMKTLRAQKLIDSYHWIGAGSQSIMDDLHDTLKFVGPVCFGINWYESMFSTTPGGLLEVTITPKPAGGHAICAHDWVNKKLEGTAKRHDYIVLQNSWGDDWGGKYKGKGGYAYLRVEDAEAILNKGGEGAVPIRNVPIKETA